MLGAQCCFRLQRRGSFVRLCVWRLSRVSTFAPEASLVATSFEEGLGRVLPGTPCVGQCVVWVFDGLFAEFPFFRIGTLEVDAFGSGPSFRCVVVGKQGFDDSPAHLRLGPSYHCVLLGGQWLECIFFVFGGFNVCRTNPALESGEEGDGAA